MVSPSSDLMDLSKYFCNDIGSPPNSSYYQSPKLFTSNSAQNITLFPYGIIGIAPLPPATSTLIVTENIDAMCRSIGLKGLH